MGLGTLLLSLLLFIASMPANAVAASVELKRLQKCYALMVGERILKSDPLFVAVSAGNKNGIDACMEVFDRAQLNADGKINFLNGKPDPVGSKVLNTFTEFHRNDLENPDYYAASGGSLTREMDVFDTNEPALHFIYPLFKRNEPYSNLVRRSQGIRAIRYSGRTDPRTLRVMDRGQIKFSQGPVGGVIPWNPTLIDVGLLAGLVPDSVQNPIQKVFATSLSAYNGSNTNAHFGGGLMGTQSYLFANWNGSNFRIWAKSVLSDLLCKQIPALRSVDVIASIRPESELPWRQGISCMQCHDSIDPLAGASRHFFKIRATAGDENFNFWAAQTPSASSAPYPDLKPDTLYNKRPADYILSFRSYQGNLVQLSGNGLNELGASIAQTDDFYACTAKKYFGFFTGITVDLQDDSDPMNPLILNSKERKLRNQVIDFGQKLKQEQDARELIKRIISLPAFVDPDRGV